MPNYELAAQIAAERGLVWLRHATNAELSAATDETLRAQGLAQDSRAAIVCMKAIRAYATRIKLGS